MDRQGSDCGHGSNLSFSAFPWPFELYPMRGHKTTSGALSPSHSLSPEEEPRSGWVVGYSYLKRLMQEQVKQPSHPPSPADGVRPDALFSELRVFRSEFAFAVT